MFFCNLSPNIFLCLQVGNVVREVYSRATKNCPWVGELWVRYLLCLERGHASEEELASVCYNWCLSFGAIVLWELILIF